MRSGTNAGLIAVTSRCASARRESRQWAAPEMSGPIHTIAVKNRLDGCNNDILDRRIGLSIDGGERRIVLDLSEVTYVSSAGLRSLLLAAKRMKAVGGRLVLLSSNRQVDRILDVSGFKSFLEIESSPAAARRRLDI
jgi:anti-anti-sigma factor